MDIERHLHDYDNWADKFQQLPLCFMGFYGSADISTVIEVWSMCTLEYVYVYVYVGVRVRVRWSTCTCTVLVFST